MKIREDKKGQKKAVPAKALGLLLIRAALAAAGLLFMLPQTQGMAKESSDQIEDWMLKVEGTPGELIFGKKEQDSDKKEDKNTEDGGTEDFGNGSETHSEKDESLSEEEAAQAREAHRFLTMLPEGFRYPMTLDEAAAQIAEEGIHIGAEIRTIEDMRQIHGVRPVYPNEQFAEISYDELMGKKEKRSFAMLEAMLRGRLESYDGDWSVYVKNLTTQESLVINDEPMKSASVMKLFIMGAVYEAIESGELERTEEVMSLMELMITVSDNEASNQLLYMLGDSSYEAGIERVNEFIRAHEYSARTVEYNGFSNSATVMDENRSNQVTAKDCGVLLEDIYRRRWGSRKVSNEIEQMLLSQNTRYKIPAGLPEGVLCGNKTGEMETTENDAAIIFGEDCDYILVVLSSDWGSKSEAIERIASVSEMVYDFLND